MKRLIVGIAVAAAVLLPTSLQAESGGKKVKLPKACTQALGAAATAFESFDVVFGAPDEPEDLGVLGDYIGAVTSGAGGDAELEELSEAANAGQAAERDFLELVETCGEKARL